LFYKHILYIMARLLPAQIEVALITIISKCLLYYFMKLFWFFYEWSVPSSLNNILFVWTSPLGVQLQDIFYLFKH